MENINMPCRANFSGKFSFSKNPGRMGSIGKKKGKQSTPRASEKGGEKIQNFGEKSRNGDVFLKTGPDVRFLFQEGFIKNPRPTRGKKMSRGKFSYAEPSLSRPGAKNGHVLREFSGGRKIRE